MRTRLLSLSLAAAAVAGGIAAGPASAAPPNDNFANAATIGSGLAANFTTAGATTEAAEPSLAGDGHTVWFKWSTQNPGGARIKVPAHHKQVFTGTSLATLKPVVGLKYDTSYYPVFQAKANTTYYIRLDDENFYGDLDPASGTLQIERDTWAPETSFDPAPAVVGPDGGVLAKSTEPGIGSYITCTLDGAPVKCSRLWGGPSEADLPAGPHTATAVATDPFMNVDPTPAVHKFTVDATAPTVTFTQTAPAEEEMIDSTFTHRFVASEPNVKFECWREGWQPLPQGWTSCVSGWKQGYYDGAHTIKVRATDEYGNVGAPASLTFTMDRAGALQRRAAAQAAARKATADAYLASRAATTSGTGTGTSTGSGTGTGAYDNRRCDADLVRERRIRRLGRKTLARRGTTLKFRGTGALPCKAELQLRVGGRLVFHKRFSVVPGATSAVRVKFDATARRRVRTAKPGRDLAVALETGGAVLKTKIRLG